MGLTPTKEAIIGQFINGRNAQDDFLQLASNRGGIVFGWIDADGHLQGSLLTGTGGTPAGPIGSVQFNNSGSFGGSTNFTFDSVTNTVAIAGSETVGPASSGLAANIQTYIQDTKLLVISLNDPTAATVTQKAIQGISQTNVFDASIVGTYGVGATTRGGGGISGVSGIGVALNPVIGGERSVDDLYGGGFEAVCLGLGGVLRAQAVYGIVEVGTGVTVTEARNFYSDAAAGTNLGSIGTFYGYYCQNLHQGTVGTSYAFFSEDQGIAANTWAVYTSGSTPSFFGGVITSNANIVTGSSLVAAGDASLGGNLNLYGNTPATSLVNVVFGHVIVAGNYWTGSVSAEDSWTETLTLGTGTNPTSTFTIAHTGTPGVATLVLAGLTLPAPAGAAAVTQTIASGTQALATTLIASGTAATTISVAATGVLSTDNVMADFNADPTGVVGYQPSVNGMLTIIKFCTAGFVNFIVVNNTGAGITPGAVTLNFRVVR